MSDTIHASIRESSGRGIIKVIEHVSVKVNQTAAIRYPIARQIGTASRMVLLDLWNMGHAVRKSHSQYLVWKDGHHWESSFQLRAYSEGGRSSV